VLPTFLSAVEDDFFHDSRCLNLFEQCFDKIGHLLVCRHGADPRKHEVEAMRGGSLPKKATKGGFPIFIEAKSAGDFTNTNKRRKEEAMKMTQLRSTYGRKVQFSLFLCGYFDSGYLGYEAAEGIDWVWEHRIDDLALIGI